MPRWHRLSCSAPARAAFPLPNTRQRERVMGIGSSSTAQQWDGSTMASQANKIAIVTGANSGIGYFTARALAASGARVILACRSESRGRAAADEMTQYLKDKAMEDKESEGQVEFMQVDMGNMESVRSFAADFRRRFDRLDLLVNNAGVAMPPEQYTADGIEMHFGVNHISHFLLTSHLLPLLRASPLSRIVNVSSVDHRDAHIDFDCIVKGIDRKSSRFEWLTTWSDFSTYRIHYGWSKLANLLFAYELSRRLSAAKIANVLSVSAHPGLSYTPIHDKVVELLFPRFLWGLFSSLIRKLPAQPAEMGALPILYASTAEDVQTGDYYGPDRLGGLRGYPVKEESRPQSHDEADAARLWALSEELIRERFEVQ